MGNSSCTLVVRLEGQPVYASGDTVTGRVYLSVTDPNGIPCNSLNIHFYGKETAVVHYMEDFDESDYGNRNHHHHHHHHRNDYYEENESLIINSDVPLYRPINGIIMPGQYEFPFQFMVPSNIPSSMKCHNGESNCRVNYEFKAYFNKQSSRSFTLNPFHQLNNTISSKVVKVTILGSSDTVTAPVQELYFPTESYTIRNCCKKMGHMELSAKIDSHLLQVNPFNPRTHVVTFDLKNYSKIDVENVKMELVECISWRSRTRKQSHRVTLVQGSLDAGAFDSWKCFDQNSLSSPNGHTRPLESTLLMHDTDTTSEGQRHPARFTFVVPNKARDSFIGNLIEVSHFVKVKAKTAKCCTTNPEISADVQVCRPPPSLFHDPSGSGSAGAGATVTGSIVSGMDEVYPTAPNATESGVVLDAVALPPGWMPQTADLVTLPVAVECSSEEDGNGDGMVQPLPSAPPITEKHQ